MDLSIIIPIYNEEANINYLYQRLKPILQQMGVAYELIFVNDGSIDKSLVLIKALAGADPKLKYIDFSRNFGHQIAITAGLENSSGKAVVFIDADLQDPPELIPQLFSKWQEGYQVVYAKRRSRKGEGYMKRMTAKMFYRLLSRITTVYIPIDTGDFRIVDRKVINILKQMPEQHKFLRGQISWIGFNQTYIEYDRNERKAGKTNYTYKKMFSLAIDGITSFSNFPLRFATYTGFFVSAIAFFLIIYALYGRFILKSNQPGWTSLMLSVLFIGGIQLLCIGIIGEYISRMSSNVRNRPLYVIKESNIE